MKDKGHISAFYNKIESSILIVCGLMWSIYLEIADSISILILNVHVKDIIILPRILFFVLVIALVFLFLLDKKEKDISKTIAIYQIRYYSVWGFSAITCLFLCKNITQDTFLFEIQWWWWLLFFFSGFLLKEAFHSIIVAIRLIPRVEEAKRLLIPKISVITSTYFFLSFVYILLSIFIISICFRHSNKSVHIIFIPIFLFFCLFGIFESFNKRTFEQDQKLNRLFNNHLFLIKKAETHMCEVGINSNDKPKDYVKKIQKYSNKWITDLKFIIQDKVIIELIPSLKVTDLKHQIIKSVRVIMSIKNNEQHLEINIPVQILERYYTFRKPGRNQNPTDYISKMIEQTALSCFIIAFNKSGKIPLEAPLVSLIFGGNYFIVREILSSCTIDLNKQETRGWTPLLAASAQNRQDIVKILLEKGANPDIPNLIQVTPLMMAAHHGFFQVCSLLIEYGASINMQDEEGNTALYVASKMGHIRIVQLLLSNHAKPDIPTCSGKTPLDIAYDNSHGEIAKIIRNHINHSQ